MANDFQHVVKYLEHVVNTMIAKFPSFNHFFNV